MNPKSKQQLREQAVNILTTIANDVAEAAILHGSADTATLDVALEKLIQAFESFHTGEVEKMVKEAEKFNYELGYRTAVTELASAEVNIRREELMLEADRFRKAGFKGLPPGFQTRMREIQLTESDKS